ncbi:MAG: hypothetical protein KAS59_08720 [Alphaproteobacteria bacterium]|nr:hypothetical protein [Alphaproteobacteria bacterium]
MNGFLKKTFCISDLKPEKKAKRPAPLSIRLTAEQRYQLEEMAAGQSLNAYIKTVLFQDKTKSRKVRNKQPIKDHKKLALALGILGRLNTLDTLEKLLNTTDSKNAPLLSFVQRDILQACTDIRLIRCYLITALGVKAE